MIDSDMMLVGHHREERICRLHSGNIEKELSAKGWVLLYDEPVLRFKGTFVVQNLLRDLFLSEIMAEGGHRDRTDHILRDPERPRQGRRKNADIEGVSKGVVVVVLQLADGVEEIFADGQAGHNRTDDLASPDDPLGLSRFEIGEGLLGLSQKSKVSRNRPGEDGVGFGPLFQFQGTGDDLRTLVGGPISGNNVPNPVRPDRPHPHRLQCEHSQTRVAGGIERGRERTSEWSLSSGPPQSYRFRER